MTPLATDNLIGPNTESIATYSANWTLGLNTFNVTTNGGVGGNSVGSMAFWNATSFPNDQYSQATINTAGTPVQYTGVAVRCASTGNGYYFIASVGASSAYSVSKRTSGGTTNLSGTTSHSFAIGDVLLLTVGGSSIAAYQNGVLLFTTIDSSITTGAAGVCGQNTGGPAITNWSGGELDALLGQTIASASGGVGNSISNALTAQTILCSQYLIPTPTTQILTLGPQSITSFEGTILTGESLGPQTITSAVGTLTASKAGNVTLGLSALTAGFSQGILGDQVIYDLDNTISGINLIGQTLTSSEGTLTAGPSPTLTAQTITSVEGVPTLSSLTNIVGLALVSLEGTIVAVTPGTTQLQLGSQVIASSEGALSFSASYAVTAETVTAAEGTLTFSISGPAFILGGQTATFAEGTISVFFLGGMPSVIGLLVEEAELVLQQVGAINPNALGYFSTYPITFDWVPSQYPPGTVLAQLPRVGSSYKVNGPITLTLSEFPMAVISP
jgi:hypothetical protein